MRFVLVCFWVVCVFNLVHAADLDENTPLIAPPAVRGHLALNLWEAKVDQALKEEEQAWVVSLPARGGQYCVTCDLQQETVRMKYSCGQHRYKTIEPYINCLRDQFLRGLCVKPGHMPPQMDVDFGVRYVDSRNFTQDSFLSSVLRKFLCRDLSVLEKKGKVFFDGFAQPLTKGMRQVIPPRLQTLRWVVSSKKDLLDAVQKETRATTSIFVVVGPHGVLKGEMERSKQLFAREKTFCLDCLLSYKVNAIWRNDWQKKYPFSPEGYKHCLNYKKKFGRRK